MRVLESAGIIEFTRDEHGKEVGVVVKVKASVTGSSSVSARAEVRHKDDTPTE